MPPFVIRVKTSSSNTRKLIISVSKKILKKAVDRNLIKRRVRAILLPLIKKNKNLEVTVIAKRGILETSFKDLKTQIEKSLSPRP